MALKTYVIFLAGALCVVPALAGISQVAPSVIVPASSKRSPAEAPGKAHTNYSVYVGAWKHQSLDQTRSGPVAAITIDGYHPADIRAAYGMPDDGGAKAIAIVDAFHLPTALNDFNVFSSTFGLPLETSTNATASTNKVLQVVYASGNQPVANGDWGGEIALDIEWAHAVAPKAKIYLIECDDNSFSSLIQGIQLAANIPDVRQISMSFGGTEFSSEVSLDSNFLGTNKTFFAAAGDVQTAGTNLITYPSTSPNVIGVGGTALTINNGIFVSETAWSESGGGPSKYEPRPSYQNSVSSVVGSLRGSPDIAAVADPNTGCAVYDSTPVPSINNKSGWLVFGGTSLATPVVAAVTNVRGYYTSSSVAELNRQYSLQKSSFLRDVVSGQSGIYPAKTGYDFVTGIGCPTETFGTFTSTPTGVAAAVGTGISGVPSSVVLKDNQNYVVRSVTSSGVQTSAIQGTLKANAPTGTSEFAGRISVTGNTTTGTTTLRLLNTTTNVWDVVGTLGLSTANKTVTVTIPNPANYFNVNGTVQFRVYAVGATTQLRLGLDQVMLTTTPN